MRGMSGAHDALSAPLTKNTVETAIRAVRNSPAGSPRLPPDGAHAASVASAPAAKWHTPRVPLGPNERRPHRNSKDRKIEAGRQAE